MAEHSVKTHLGVAARDYDRAIRVFVPHYDEMIGAAVAWLDQVPERGLVLDLGAGTGALAEAVLRAHPVRVCLIDVDRSMLEVAGERLADRSSQVELRAASFDDPLPECDAVVASLALHHVREVDAKRTLYRRIREALRPGGVLAVADVTVHESGPERDRVFGAWTRWMTDRGVSAEQARAHFDQWAAEDRYLPLPVELELLRDAGFARPECAFRRGPATVFGGFA